MSLDVKNQSNQVPAGKWVRPPPLNTNLPVLKTLDYSLSIAENYEENTPLSRTIGPILRAPIFPSRFGLPEKHFGFHPELVQNYSSEVSPSSPALKSSDESPCNVSSKHHLDDSSPVFKVGTNVNASDIPTSASTQPPVSPLLRNVTQKLNLPDYLTKSFEKWLDQVSSPKVTVHYTQLDEPNQLGSTGTTNPTQETSSDCDHPVPDGPFDFRNENCYDSE